MDVTCEGVSCFQVYTDVVAVVKQRLIRGHKPVFSNGLQLGVFVTSACPSTDRTIAGGRSARHGTAYSAGA